MFKVDSNWGRKRGKRVGRREGGQGEREGYVFKYRVQITGDSATEKNWAVRIEVSAKSFLSFAFFFFLLALVVIIMSTSNCSLRFIVY